MSYIEKIQAEIADKGSRFCVVSHDAGAAEILSSLVRPVAEHCNFYLEGPAKPIFFRKLGPIQISSSLESAIIKSDWYLCGTSWKSDLDLRGIQMAKRFKKSTVAFLDHWSNYSSRFNWRNDFIFPDEIWVGDQEAKIIAQKAFKKIRIKYIENPYLCDIIQESRAFTKKPKDTTKNDLSILYICEPILEHAEAGLQNMVPFGYTESDALMYFANWVSQMARTPKNITIRPHPSEAIGKYDWVKNVFKCPICFGGEKKLVQEIYENDMVVGCESMALVVALFLNKPVFSSIPPGGKPSCLPFDGIKNLANLKT